VRATARKVDGKWKGRTYDPGTANDWKAAVWLTVGQSTRVLEGPVSVRLDLFFSRPQRLRTRALADKMVRHTAKPDTDNAAKAILDCMTMLGWWRDDAQVAELTVTKWYAANDSSPGARIFLEELAA
jgi:Holliday junction resolvase RusA-like endonuclease